MIFRLTELAEITMGQSPSGDTCNTDGTGTPLLNGPTEFGSRFPSPAQYTTDPKKIAQPQDLLFCVRGSTTGRMNFADQLYAIGRGIASIRSKYSSKHTVLLRRIIELVLPRLLQSASGSTFPNVSRPQLENLQFDLPDIDTQERLADFVVAIDDKIELNRQMNETLEQMAMTLYKNWFVDFGPFQDGEFVESELGMIPKGWAASTLDNVLEFAYGKSLPEKNRIPGPFPVYGSSGVVGTHNESLVKAPGIIVGRKGTIGKIHLARSDFYPIDTTYYVKPLDPSWSFPLQYCLLQQYNFSNMNNDSAVPGLNRNDVYSLPMVIPTRVEVTQLAEKIQPYFDLMASNDEETENLESLRDYLLPRLLSGEIELGEAEEQVEEALTHG